jgi:hypothetical protein
MDTEELMIRFAAVVLVLFAVWCRWQIARCRRYQQ